MGSPECFFDNVRQLLRPMVDRRAKADEVYQKILRSGLSMQLLEFDPKVILEAHSTALPSDFHIPLLIQLHRIYREENNKRGEAFAGYYLARMWQRNWPGELAHAYRPLLMSTADILYHRPSGDKSERELLQYSLEHLSYAHDDAGDIKAAAQAMWRAMVISLERDDADSALHFGGCLLSSRFQILLDAESLPTRKKLVELVEPLLRGGSDTENSLTAVMGCADYYIAGERLSKALDLIDELVDNLPDGPSQEKSGNWTEVKRVQRALRQRIGHVSAIAAVAEESSDERNQLQTIGQLMKSGDEQQAFRILREMAPPKTAGGTLIIHFLRAKEQLDHGHWLDGLAEIDQAFDLFDGLATARDVVSVALMGVAAGVRADVVGLRAELLHRLGRFAEARNEYRRAMHIALDQHYLGLNAIRLNLANLFREHQDFEDALGLYDECIATARQTGDKKTEAKAIGNKGLLRCDQGRFGEGWSFLIAAIDLADQDKDAWAVNHFRTCSIVMLVNSLCDPYNKVDQDLNQVGDQLDRLLEDAGSLGNAVVALLGSGAKAVLSLLQNDPIGSEGQFRKFWRDVQEGVLGLPGAQDVPVFLRHFRLPFKVMAHVFMERGDITTARSVCELLRDSGMLMLRKHALISFGDNVPSDLREAWLQVSRRLAAVSGSLHFDRLSPGAAGDLRRVRNEHQEIFESIVQTDPEWGHRQSLEFLQSGYSGQGLLLDRSINLEVCDTWTGIHIFLHRHRNRDRRTTDCLFVAKSELHLSLKILADIYLIDPSGQEERQQLISRLCIELGKVLVPRISSLLPKGSYQITVIPSSNLVGVPFNALVDPSNGVPFGQTHEVAISPSLRALHAATETDVGRRKEALLVGDPQGNLPNAKKEAEMLRQSHPSIFTSDPLIGFQAESSAVLQCMKNARWIHLACHGEFNVHKPSDSAIMLADGRLTAETLMQQLSLFGCDGVVQTACEVGRSAPDGFDPLGMTGVLLAAGARSVVAPLWPIADVPALLFGKLLYYHLETENLGVATSRARNELRQLTRERAVLVLGDAEFLQPFTGKRPFEAAVHWAGYQAHGAPFHSFAIPPDSRKTQYRSDKKGLHLGIANA